MGSSGQVVNITINVQDADGGAVVEQVIAQLDAIGPAAQVAGARATEGLASIEIGANKARAAVAGLSASWKGVMSGGIGTAGTSTAFQSMFMAGGATGQWSQFKNAAQTATKEAADGLDHVGKHALTSLDNVRLLRDDIGIRIPRSMEKAIANSALLSGAIGSIGTGLLAIGAIDILMRMGESAYAAYEKYILLEGVLRDSEAVFKSLGDSAAAAMQRAADETEQYIRLTKGAQAADEFKLQRVQTTPTAISIYQDDRFKGLPDLVKGDFEKITGESVMPKDLPATIDKLVDYENKQKAILKNWHEIQTGSPYGLQAVSPQKTMLQEQRVNTGDKLIEYLRQQQNENVAAVKAGTAQIDEDRKQKSAEYVARERAAQDQIIQLQNEATNAGLEGNALRAAQEQQEIDDITRKFQGSEKLKQLAAQGTADIQRKFAAQAMMQQQQLEKQTKQMADEAAQAGLKGKSLIEAQMWSKLDAINAAEDAAVGANGGIETDAQRNNFASQRASAVSISNQKMMESNQEFAEHLRQITDSSDAYQLQGYSRIESETQRHLDTLESYYKQFGAKDGSDFAAYQAVKTQIEADADRERQQLHQRTMEQIAKEEEQAARMGLPDWQQSQAAIVDAYNDRFRQITEAENQQLAYFKGNATARTQIEIEAQAQIAAAAHMAQAQMERDAQQTRDRLASTLSDFFSNPAKYIEKRAMDTAFQIMANGLMNSFQKAGAGSGALQWLFGMGPQMSTSANPLTDLHSIFKVGGGVAATDTAGMTLNTAGTQLLSAGNLQLMAANATLTAATALGSAASALAVGSASQSIPAGTFDALGSTGGMNDAGGGLAGAGGGDFNFGSPGMIAGGAAGDYSTSIGDGSLSSELGKTSALGSAGGMAGKALGAAGGAFTAGFGIYDAYENSNPLSGAISGAVGGAEIGALFGPMGMGIGAVVGGLAGMFAGIFGDHGKGKAEDYDKNTVQPGLAKYMQDFEAGRAGYNQVARDIDQLMTQAETQTTGWGSGARGWYSGHIAPEITAALASVHQQERGGRSAITMSAAQYHTGGWVGDFGDFDFGNGEGFAKLLRDEYVVQPMAARSHAPLLHAINAGNVSYARSVQPRMPAGASGSPMYLTIKALDSQDVAQWARAGGGRALVSAINQAQRQYSGVGRG